MRIYDYYFGETKECYIGWSSRADCLWRRDPEEEAYTRGSQILYTCKTVYCEALPVMLANSHVSVSLSSRGLPVSKYRKSRALDKIIQCSFLAAVSNVAIIVPLPIVSTVVHNIAEVLEIMDYGESVKYLAYDFNTFDELDEEGHEQYDRLLELLRKSRCKGNVQVTFIHERIRAFSR